MPIIIPVGFGHAVYEFNVQGDSEPIVVTMGHELVWANGGDWDAGANELFDRFADTVLPAMWSGVTLERVTVYAGAAEPPYSVHDSTRAPEAGGTGTGSTTINTAVLMRKRTDLAGKRGRGRCYLYGPQVTQVAQNGVMLAGEVARWQAACDAWFNALTTETGGATLAPVVLHRSEGTGVEPAPTPVRAFVVDEKVATQRRRLRP